MTGHLEMPTCPGGILTFPAFPVFKTDQHACVLNLDWVLEVPECTAAIKPRPIDKSAVGLGSWRVRRLVLRVLTFASKVANRPNILKECDSRVLRSEAATGAFR